MIVLDLWVSCKFKSTSIRLTYFRNIIIANLGSQFNRKQTKLNYIFKIETLAGLSSNKCYTSVCSSFGSCNINNGTFNSYCYCNEERMGLSCEQSMQFFFSNSKLKYWQYIETNLLNTEDRVSLNFNPGTSHILELQKSWFDSNSKAYISIVLTPNVYSTSQLRAEIISSESEGENSDLAKNIYIFSSKSKLDSNQIKKIKNK